MSQLKTPTEIETNKSNKLIQVKGLKTEFLLESGILTAVDGISFTINKGETLGIVGESGSGKSVTSFSIMRLLPERISRISQGEILFTTEGDEVDLLALSEEGIRLYRGAKMSMIFQEPMTSLNPTHRCGAQVEEALLLHTPLTKQEAKAEVIALFEKVKLPDPQRVYRAYPHQLSGGQLQRVMIAMAISCKPQLLIADEPTTALDVTVQKEILSLLKELQQETGMAVIFISHDLGVISEIADRVIVMYKGKIVEEGGVKELMQRPRHAYTRGLIACRPPTKFRLTKLSTVQDFLADEQLNQASFRKAHLMTEEMYLKKQIKLKQKEVLLEVKELSKHYVNKKSFFGRPKTWTKAVDRVSFVVRRGESLGLVGESGCGKSTLGLSILNLIRPSGGKVIFEQKFDVLDLDASAMRALRKDIQIIFQDPYSSLNPRMKIGKAIQEPMDLHKLHGNKVQRKQKVEELLEKVGLEKAHYDRYPHEFSGGQRQRICIARTLAVEPKFIICDESVSALDVSVQAQVLNLLNDLKEEFDLTYIFISHDLSVVKHFCDTILVMKEGKIVEKGDAEQVFHHPEHAYTQHLISSIPGREF